MRVDVRANRNLRRSRPYTQRLTGELRQGWEILSGNSERMVLDPGAYHQGAHLQQWPNLDGGSIIDHRPILGDDGCFFESIREDNHIPAHDLFGFCEWPIRHDALARFADHLSFGTKWLTGLEHAFV